MDNTPNTIEKLNRNDCCGCSSCAQKCPKNAITMQENEEGFLYPVIDKEKCVNCGLCSKACPQLNDVKGLDDGYPKAYAMRNKNNEELSKSSSGGIFSILANYVIEKDGIVFGAAYDENLNINHIKATSKEELNPIRSSKYVQSNINDTYKEAEVALKDGQYVLYTGTPCQIAGLNTYLGKEYDKLITADLVCHGVPSQELFHKYIDYLSDKFKSRVIEYNFRSKEKKGWGLVSKVTTEDGKVRFIEPDFDPYYSNFLECVTYRENCYQCHYTNYNRVSDITMADYWGINEIHPQFYKEEGNSLVLINNDKAERLIEELKDTMDFMPTDLDKAASHNKNLIEPSKKSVKRELAYKGIKEKESKTFIKENLKCKVTLKKVAKTIIPTKIKKQLKKMKGIGK